jgi:chloramphenicol-sensitive protein RarD
MTISSAHFAAIFAFSLWGLFPLYWKLFPEMSAWDLFAHRLVWSFLTLLTYVLFKKKLSILQDIWRAPKTRWMLILSAGLISSNWLLYIYAINTDRVLEASMGYFLNPIINVLMGRIILKENMRLTQWPSLILAILAIVLIGIQSDINHIPWLALILSVTFALYGLIRKLVHVGSLEGLSFETSVVVVPTLIAWFFRPTSPLDAPQLLSSWKMGLLTLSGLVTCTPLVLFAYGAKRLPLSTLGFIQYLSPSLKFICGWLILKEPLSAERLQAFYLIWIALAWYTAESYFFMKKKRILTTESK